MPEERALVGAQEIAHYLRWPLKRVYQKSKEMQEAKCLFKEVFGQPKDRKRVLYTFPSLLQLYYATREQ